MTGKSRLLKEIAMTIPTMYICVRDPDLEIKTSYPASFNRAAVDYLLQDETIAESNDPTINPDLSIETAGPKCQRRFTFFILAMVQVFQTIEEFSKGSPTPRDLREFLWYLLAEPDSSRFAELCSIIKINDATDPEKTYTFFLKRIGEAVGSYAKKFIGDDLENSDEINQLHCDLNDTFQEQWEKLLNCIASTGETSHDKAVLLFVWDEARTFLTH